MKGKYRITLRLFYFLLAILVSAPFYLCLIYTFKESSDIAFGKLGPPSYLYLGNLTAVLFKNPLFFTALKNSVLVTVPSVIVLQVICSTGAYVLARNNNFICKAIYSLFLASILIPFQSVMLSTYIDLKAVNLINTRLGFVLVRIGFTIAFNSLIITSFVKNIPLALEEAASIDGAGRFTSFWKVVFPLMQPVNVSVLVLNFLFVWDDFGIALIILQKAKVRTLPMAQYAYFGEITTDLHSAFAFTVLSMIPVVLLYLFFQKHIVEGVTAGAVKG